MGNCCGKGPEVQDLTPKPTTMPRAIELKEEKKEEEEVDQAVVVKPGGESEKRARCSQHQPCSHRAQCARLTLYAV
jgi:hypothetical protein